ncbi:MAG: nitroreductase family protein [Syntrophales bacterium]|nr:nitroreductase family protein [Syntrophales bacterium]
MSHLDELINKRRSIRKYKTDVPPEDWINSMIRYAAMAPSPKNSRPVRFIKIVSPESRDNLYRAMANGQKRRLQSAQKSSTPNKLKNRINMYWRFSKFMFDAPVLFAVGAVSPERGSSGKLPRTGINKKVGRGDTDIDITVGLAVKGFLLKGEELGLGTCIMTAPFTFVRDVENILGIEDVKIKCFVTVGFPDEKPDAPERINVADICREI